MTTPREPEKEPLPTAGAAPVWQPQIAQSEAPNPARRRGAFETAAVAPANAPVAIRRAPATTAGKARRFSSTTILLVISALIALGGVGFAVGRATPTGSTSAANGANGIAGGFGADVSGRPNFGAGASGVPGAGGPAGLTGSTTISGTVVSSTADSITIQLAGGQTVTLGTGSSTTYHGQTSATVTDVAVGATVTVQTSAAAASASGSPSAGSSAGTAGTRTAIDVTITGN
jgi:hypothetical protein